MPPLDGTGLGLGHRLAVANFSRSAYQERKQWTEPVDVVSVLLLLGGEIVSKALAQLAGGIFTPVTFSFGWVSYAVTMLLASVGEAKLMPRAAGDQCLIVTAKSGYTRSNNSWIISRISRDYEGWMHPVTKQKLEAMLDERANYMRRNPKAGRVIQRRRQTGLCIAIYEPSQSAIAGEPKHDFIYWSGAAVTLIQLVIAAIPFATTGEWIIFVITVCGTILTLVTGSLPQWKAEKWACRRNSPNTYIMTQGNGSQHVVVILGNGRGLNLEDLATDRQKYPSSNRLTRFILATIAASWISLLIVAAGVSTNTWYLLGVGITGMLQNILVVGWRRDPSALGVHLDFKQVIGEMRTMDSLLALEAEIIGLGRCLLPIFFPGELLPEEVLAWDALKDKAAAEEERRQRENQDGRRADHPKEGWVAHARNFESHHARNAWSKTSP
ncbi:hypothetical protein ONZ43_g4770 [Nemania bipapillata]|uniref:Uncharacterized protein n=1 Tax=Nemania bipapillata TaxID=110536 RepID=A0ACC2IIT3_9PEZI|nr:hypothetical protein ONZ43_g4770 [Nemania bipapillata]